MGMFVELKSLVSIHSVCVRSGVHVQVAFHPDGQAEAKRWSIYALG